MKRRPSGKFVSTWALGEKLDAYVPSNLPPKKPIQLNETSSKLLEDTIEVINKLNIISSFYPRVKDLVELSIRIESWSSGMIDNFVIDPEKFLLLLDDSLDDGVFQDAQVFKNCVKSITFALSELDNPDGQAISLKRLHSQLMTSIDGIKGDFRNSQTWIGASHPKNAIFIPPPPEEMLSSLNNLLEYMQKNDDLSSLARVGVIHAQFESIHPFLEANGRVGRLLILILLKYWQILKEPLIPISWSLLSRRDLYLNNLNAVRTDGDFELFIDFFLESLQKAAQFSLDLSQKLIKMTEDDYQWLLLQRRASVTSIRLLNLLPAHPILSISKIVDLMNSTKPTVIKAVNVFVESGLLREATGKKRDRIFVYGKYIELFQEVKPRF